MDLWAPLRASHSLTVLSLLAVANNVPLGLNATAVTSLRCATHALCKRVGGTLVGTLMRRTRGNASLPLLGLVSAATALFSSACGVVAACVVQHVSPLTPLLSTINLNSLLLWLAFASLLQTFALLFSCF